MTGPVATVIGWPIAHSRSPVIHRFWLKEHGLAGDYITVAVEPGGVADHFARVRGGEYVGTNVTIPHKEAAFAGVDRRTASAEATEALNTVWVEDGALVGANTDPEGFAANLDDGAPGWPDRTTTAVVLGAGGAARGVVHALKGRGVERIVIANRTFERAVALAEAMGSAAQAAPWDRLPTDLSRADLVVNATALGMTGRPPLDVPVDALPDRAIVTDIVYTPLETPLLAAARSRGLTAVDGLGMLLHQAVPGFERWFGVRPKVTPALRDAVLEAL